MEKQRIFAMVLCLCIIVVSICPGFFIMAMTDSGYGSTSGGDSREPLEVTVEPTYPIVTQEPVIPQITVSAKPTEVIQPPEESEVPEGNENGEIADEGGDRTPGITNIIMNCECVGVLNQILLELQKNKPSVTALYSENRRISGCYYRPDYNELMKHADLAAEIALDYKFAAVYGGYFNLYDKEIWETGEYKPEGTQCRELEVLGYDFLLEREEYDEEKKVYIPTVYNRDSVTWQVAVMDLYKALEKEIISYALYFESDENAGERVKLDNSPISQNLPSYVSDLDTSRVETHLFVTRTYAIDRYYDRAVSELGLERLYMREDIGNSDFIIMVASAMQMYGEPVMSEMEMNLLLQVYGGTIPEYLNEIERDAYLYLKARGVLNVNLDYTQKLKFNDMLNILMCVKDKASRTDFKSIQVTMDIGEELINMGYFPKTVNIVDGSPLYTEDRELTDKDLIAEVDYYDYFILIDKDTEFLSKETGVSVTDEKIFISAVNGENEEGARTGTRYLGRKTLGEQEYYHFQAPQVFEGIMEFNTEETTDSPYYLRIPRNQLKGGIFVFGKTSKGGVTLKRESSFGAVKGILDIYDLWDNERVKSAKKTSWLKDFGEWLFPVVQAYAGEVVGIAYPRLSGGQNYNRTVEFLVYNVDSNTKYVGDENRADITDNGDGTWTVRTSVGSKQYVMNHIIRGDIEPGVTYGAICNLAGDVLVNYDTLVAAGLFYNDYGTQVPTPDDQNGQILRLTGKFGQVKLNNSTREIVVGNVVYKLKNDGGVGLFKFIEEKGEQKLYVDFRVAYGWALDKIRITITGTAQSYTLNVYDRASSEGLFTSVGILPVEPFETKEDSQEQNSYLPGTSIEVVPGNMLDSCEAPSILLTSSYPLSNWIMYQGVNPASGAADEYIYVYYLRAALEDYGVEPPNGQDSLKNKLGYVVCDEELWCVREFSVEELVRKGKLRHIEGVGYLYQIPEISTVSMESYLKGDILLPIGYDLQKNYLRNINVCKFDGIKYGFRLKENNSTVRSPLKQVIDVMGEEQTMYITAGEGVIPAPVGIAALYGGGPRWYTTLENSSVFTDSNTCSFYFGINRCNLIVESSGMVQIDGLKWKGNVSGSVSGLDKIKLRVAGMLSRAFTTSTSVYTCYVLENVQLNVVAAEQPVAADIEVEAVNVVDAERKDNFTGYKRLTFRSIINRIDEGASAVIVIVFTVFPMFGVGLITMLVGLAMIADFKGARLFAEKVFDPVKLLTFGKRNMNDFRLQDCMFSMFVGYTVFALLYNGNLVRILTWVFDLYDKAVNYIKYL